MAGFLTPVGKKYLLNALVGKGAGTRSVYLGLAEVVPVDGTVNLTTITETSVGGYARAQVEWNDAVIDGTSVYVKNTNEEGLGTVTADMNAAYFAFLTDFASGSTVAAPVLTKGAASAGGTFAAGTYYWKITALNANGETTASNEVSATLTANQQQVLNWTAVPGATGYNIYRGTTAGGENVKTTVGNVTTYTATGASGTASAPPPTTNTATGDVLYVWELAEPVSALASKPILVPAQALVIE